MLKVKYLQLTNSKRRLSRETHTKQVVNEEAARVAGTLTSTTLIMVSFSNHVHLGSGVHPLSSYPGSFIRRLVPAWKICHSHFPPPPFSPLVCPTLNSPICPFHPLLATLACCRAPASSSAQVNLSSRFFTKLNLALINNAHPLYEHVLHRLRASLFHPAAVLRPALRHC